mgnify:FL=1
MFGDQGKTGIPTMVERSRLPARGGMATRAIRTAHAPVDIVLCVAGDTLAGRARPTLPGMTGKASGCAVPAGERKARSTVIER